MQYSGSGVVSAGVVPVEPSSASSGCDRSQFAGFPRGAVALVRRGVCFMAQKARNAKAAGASAVLIANDGAPGRTAPILGTLIRPGIGIPVLGISSALGSELAGTAAFGPDRRRRRHEEGAVAKRDRRPSWPETRRRPAWRTPGLGRHRAGDERQRLRLGARAGGRAAGPPPRFRPARDSASRLGRGGARSGGLDRLRAASGRAYARSSVRAELRHGRASPNFGRFVYDGEAEPPGSTRIEDHFQPSFSEEGLAGRRCPWGLVGPRALCQGRWRSAVSSPGRTHQQRDLTSRRRSGGRPYDACYHQPCDTLDNVNLRVLGQMADAAAVVALRPPARATARTSATLSAGTASGRAREVSFSFLLRRFRGRRISNRTEGEPRAKGIIRGSRRGRTHHRGAAAPIDPQSFSIQTLVLPDAPRGKRRAGQVADRLVRPSRSRCRSCSASTLPTRSRRRSSSSRRAS